ncbi:penicillin-binding transpeptidase domain-containing protein [Luteolibacter sp. GHJ8]|uniref:Beta-lactamase n=1 Tax=Luteolibacter rhizosphaerae TaxID=2989719 RepID=A0ABT3G353_9BACT|nr:penicillin-binding transpeptidase domain-containing protein [Luteolibacter rhizosphaerae]MCW1914269.1 penicillin-binding transpeptidase domain-containing protein [Luteolibacter rhizosphaerae]
MIIEPRYRLRVYLLTALVLGGFGVLLGRLYEFQIEKREEFQKDVPGPRQITVREPGVRGIIKDRHGVELARNKRKYEVSFNLQEIHDAYRLQQSDGPVVEVAAWEKGMKRTRKEADILTIVKKRIIPPLQDLGLAKDFNSKALVSHYKTHGGLVPFTYTTDIDYEQFARFAEHSLELPGVYLNVRPQREYPYKALSCHTLGYLRQWAKGDIPEDAYNKFGYQYVGDDVGVAGVEATLDDMLRGVTADNPDGAEGWKTIVKNEKGKIIGELVDAQEPGTGAEVTLTIDAEVQYLLSNVLRRAGVASGVVMDVRTGEILAMASIPDYDPNDYVPSITVAKKKEYDENKLHPMIDRSISAFSPGSTFKIPTALVGAIYGKATNNYNCSGSVRYGSMAVRCWIAKQSGGSHGSLSLPEAIQVSCNPYFMQLAGSLGPTKMNEGFRMLGFGEKTGVPLPGEYPGMIIGNRAWRRKNPNEKAEGVNMGFAAIGQGNSLATPLQLCAMICSVANGGRYYHPRLVKKAVDQRGNVLVEDAPRLKVDLVKEGIKASDIEFIRKGMWKAVNEQRGTAGRVKIPGYEIAAKTGTAQAEMVGSYQRHNSWTMAFGPYEDPRYAVVIFVHDGKSGGKVCGPLVHLVMRGLFSRDEGMKLPLHPLDPVPGKLEAIDEIPLPEDVLAAIDVTQDDGETGDEAADAAAAAGIVPGNPENDQPAVAPSPTITLEADAEGTVAPRKKQEPAKRNR